MRASAPEISRAACALLLRSACFLRRVRFGAPAIRLAAAFGRALATLLVVSAAFAATARADVGAALETFHPSPYPGDAFGVSGGDPGAHLELSLQLYADYARNPLVYEDVAGDSSSELLSLVSDQLTLHAVAALGLYDSALLFVGMPVQLWMDGEPLGSEPTATGFGAGDLWLGGRLALHQSKTAKVAVQLRVTAPTGEGGQDGRPGVAGDSSATVEPQVVATIALGPLSLLLNAGARFRKDIEFAGTLFRDVATFGLALSLPIAPPLMRLSTEVEGQAPIDDIGDRAGAPLQALLGLRVMPSQPLELGVAGGLGLLRGYGSPDARVVLNVGYRFSLAPKTGAKQAGRAEPSEPLQPELVAPPSPATAAAPEPPVVEAIADADGDGVSDLDDRCPKLPGPIEEAGCPSAIRYDEQSGEIALLQALRFEQGSARMVARDEAVLEQVAAALRANPEMRARIEAHMTRGRHGNAQQALRLSRERAKAVALWLVDHGVGVERLDALGCGANRPLVPDTGSQRFKNERVEVYIVDPLPPSGLRSSLGCTEAELPRPQPEHAPTGPAPAARAPAAPAPAARTPAGPRPAAPTQQPVSATLAASPAPAKPAAPTTPPPTASSAPAALSLSGRALAGAAAAGQVSTRQPPPAAPAATVAPATPTGPVPAPTASARAAQVPPVAAATTAAAVAAALARDPGGDADHDGVPNAKDECALAPGDKGSAHGCPESHRVNLEAGEIELLKPIHFEHDSAEISSRSNAYLDELAATLKANPKMQVLVEAHMAEEGPAEASLALSRARAANVRKQLAARGVAPGRLKAYGCGQSRPIAPNNVPWGRKKNERIELHVLDPAPSSGLHSTEGCVASE